jgi:heme exporter protein D
MSDFFAMGGYAAFVWPAFAITAIVMVWLAVSSRHMVSVAQRRLDTLQAARPRRRKTRPAQEQE